MTYDPDRQADFGETEPTYWDTNPRLDPNSPDYDFSFAEELAHEEALDAWSRSGGNEPKPTRWANDREQFHSDL